MDVPHGERRVASIALGKLGGDTDSGLTVRGGGGTVRVPTAVDKPRTVGPDREGVGVGEAEPRRRRRRRCSKDYRNARLVETLECGVQPVETVVPLARLDPGPGEYPDGRSVHTRLLH